ncbi:TonB-linked outer membrane protein, SusC/RagA family [Wenyingzhuangia marina]|uniref:TonB-linked outer membrane protein, SusC/RagA family n=2 Tax=Wenyingzhuangia marina TaxID=1195760 RepID=A0A1M5V8V6_9FLAO|nr:TonB-linked outer membrane protein, SusC/RagA family [Wenyingzhuangia marina]
MLNYYFSNYLFFLLKVRKKKKFTLNKTGLCFIAFVLFFSVNEMNAQSKTVSGTVTTKDSELPLPGATVMVKGTSNGTLTDFDGNYSLNITSENPTLIFSYVGYITQEVLVGNRKVVNFVMEGDEYKLDEVVVIGYGTTKKSDLTGAVVTLGGDELRERPVSNVAEALQGRMAGVQVTSTDGSPDSEINIRVRGGGSLTQDASPLVIVDGFPVNSISDVAPSNIENITVLKDASSTAIYGSRGANGVIIVTTKSGKNGKITTNLNAFYGVKTIANTVGVLDPEDYVSWQYEYALLTDPKTPGESGYLQSYTDYFGLWQDRDQYNGQKGNNWQKQMYGQMGEVHSRDLSVRGGTDKFNYNFNYAHYDEKSIMVGSKFKRDNLSLALKSKVNDKVDLAFTIRYADTGIENGTGAEQSEGSTPRDSRYKQTVLYSPIPISGLTTSNTDDALSNDLINPLVVLADNQREKQRKNYNLLGRLDWEIIDNLSFQTSLGLDNYNDLDYRYYGRSTYYVSNNAAAENQGMPALIFSDQKRDRFRNANTLNYDFKNVLGADHSLDLLIGEEMIISKSNEVENIIQGYPKFFDFETTKSLTTQGTPVSIDNNYSPDDKLLSFFGRVKYSYKDRYLLRATYRADGSSKFLGDNQWGYFPSAAVAWKITEEEFLKDSDFLNTLKLRVSYGQSGNNNIPSGQQVQTFQSRTTTYLNGVSNYWAASSTLANPDLKWETTVTQNVGLDFGFFNNRLTGSLEAYKNITKDLLINFPTPGTGYTSQYRNMGEVQNSGLEASFNAVVFSDKDYGLSLGLNVAMNKNKINSLGVMDDFGQATSWASTQIGNDYVVNVGQSLGAMYGYQNDGRYEVSDFDYDAATSTYTLKSGIADASAVVGNVMPGTMKLKDVSGPNGVPDGIVDINDNAIIGDANPDFTGGFTMNANAYGFDLAAIFNFSIGNDIYNASKIEYATATENGQYRNLSNIMASGNRWKNLDAATGQLVTDPTQLAAMNENTTMWSPYMQRNVFSDWAVEDGSFLRLNTITLGYTIPDEKLSKIGISKLRFYATTNNVFVLTNYSGPDPEVSTRRNTPLTPGTDYSPFPRSRSLIFGLNLNF